MTQIALTSPTSLTIQLDRGRVFSVTPGVSSSMTIAIPRESVAQSVSAASAFGPYAADREVTLNLSLGTALYEVLDSAAGAVDAASISSALSAATPAELAAIQSSVSGGAVRALSLLGKQQLNAVGFGNSITNQFPNYINYMSGSGSYAILQTTNAGVSGNTTSQMLARLESVSSVEPVVLVMECTNDANPSNSISRALHVSNMRSICTALVARGQLPIIILPPPKNTDTQAVENLRLCDYLVAKSLGIPCYDPWGVVTDPTTGGYLSQYTLDGTHPNPAGASLAGLNLSAQIASGKPAGALLNRANIKQSGLFGSNCLFLTDSNSDGVPDGWNKGGATVSLAPAAAPAIGNAMQLVITAASGYCIGPSVAVNVGDVIQFTGYYAVTTVGNSGLSASITLRTNTGYQNYAISQQGLSPMSVFTYQYVVPAGVTTLAIQCGVSGGSAGTTTLQVANLQAYNLTQALL